MNFKLKFALFMFLLAACNARHAEPAASEPTVSITSTVLAVTLVRTRTPFPTKTATPTFPPTATVPAATLHAIATVDALRIKMESQFPELQEYLTFCRASYCQGVDVSPNEQFISFSYQNVMEVLETSGKKIGKYSWYEIYGSSHGYPADYNEGGISGVHWSKDGRYLYLATAQGDGGPGPNFGYVSALARVNLQNGTWKDTGISGIFSFSPNDKYIVYSTNTSELRIRNLQSGEEQIYMTPEYYEYFGEFVWSPDGKKIVFVATPEGFDDVNNKFALFMIDLESDKTLPLYEDFMPYYYPVEWVEENKLTLRKYQEEGTWLLDLSTNPPIINP